MTGMSSIRKYESASPEEAHEAAPKSAEKQLELWAAVLAGLSLIAMISTITWGANKGFCITDEAFYILVSGDPHKYNCMVTKFGFLLNKLPMLSSSELINGRLWQLILQIIGASILSIGFVRTTGQTSPLSNSQRFIFWSLAVSGSLLIFSVFPFSASYNTLVATTAFASAGLLLCAQTLARKASAIAYLLSGAFAGLVIFSKVTSALILFPLLLAVLWANKRQRVTGLLFVTSGATLSAISYFLVVEPFANCISSFAQASELLRQTGLYTPELVLNKYVLSLIKLTLQTILHTSLIFLLSFASILVSQKFRRQGEKSTAQLLLVFTAWTLAVFYFAGYLCTSPAAVEAFYLLPALLAAALLASNVHKNKKTPLVSTNLPLFLVAALPLVCSMGTNNDVVRHTKIFVAPLILVALYLALKLTKTLSSRAPFILVAAIIMLVTGSQFFTGFMYTPYGIPLPLYEQKQVSKAPKLKNIKQSLGAKDFFDSYLDMLVAGGFRKGDTIIAAYNMPGLVYAADGCSMKFASYLPGKEGKAMFESALADLRRKAPDQFFVVTNYDGDRILEQSFASAGYRFPDEFQRIGHLSCPYDAPYVDIRTGKANLSHLHNQISILRFRKRPGAGEH
ncbi:MAG: hypothetical protein DKT66_03760 [Candidatus Melainabacteria bacterium]|nr:MAG: hypothetical protein DKT66_03760 [Candidatus Melainabacteria bacterium]